MLGENIINLRKQQQMSQGELADALEVSRQSISKWENNAAVPELDKLIRISELFQVSLDELVLGQRADAGTAGQPTSSVAAERLRLCTAQRAIGLILLILGAANFLLYCSIYMYMDPLGGLITSFPFLAAGIICLLVPWPKVLYLCWCLALVVLVYMFLRFQAQFGALISYWWQGQLTIPYIVRGWLMVLGIMALIVATGRAVYWKIRCRA